MKKSSKTPKTVSPGNKLRLIAKYSDEYDQLMIYKLGCKVHGREFQIIWISQNHLIPIVHNCLSFFEALVILKFIITHDIGVSIDDVDICNDYKNEEFYTIIDDIPF